MISFEIIVFSLKVDTIPFQSIMKPTLDFYGENFFYSKRFPNQSEIFLRLQD